MKEALPWKGEYELGFETIDRQHRTIVDSINKLHFAMQNGQSNNEMTEIIAKLKMYALTHFSYEEDLFKKFEYELTEEHTQEHKAFTEQIHEIAIKFPKRSSKDCIDKELITFLVNWLLLHIKGSDKKYTKCFDDNNLP